MGEDVQDKTIAPWVFTKDAIETYDEENEYSELEVVYFKIGENLFMDFTAGDPSKDDSEDCGNFFWCGGLTLVHSLCRIEIKDDSLLLIPANIGWVEDQIENKTLALDFVKPEDGNYIFTASSKQWVDFLKTHADDKGLFDKKIQFEFKRVTPAKKTILNASEEP